MTMRIYDTKDSAYSELKNGVSVPKGSSAQLLLVHSPSTVPQSVKLEVGKGANLELFSIYESGAKAELSFEIAAGAKVAVCDLFSGAASARLSIPLEAESISLNLIAKGIIRDAETAEYRVRATVGKKAPGCTVDVAEHAYLLGKTAKVALVPGLEVLNNDVQARHASTISQMDDEQVFYLTSRGIPEEQAKEEIVAGFMAREKARIKELFGYDMRIKDQAANMKVLVFGNPIIKTDSIAIKTANLLKDRFLFKFLDAAEDVEREGRNLVILDAAMGIDKVTLIDDPWTLETSPLYSMHDFDIALTLKLLMKVGKLDSVRIVAIPAGYEPKKAASESKKMLKQISKALEKAQAPKRRST